MPCFECHGFAGPVRRWGFAGYEETHGHPGARTPGSVGQCATPGRTLKGQRMGGRMGGVRRTVKNLEVVEVDAERNLLLLRGAVPGARSGYVYIEKMHGADKASKADAKKQ